jgi:hypothetical protein
MKENKPHPTEGWASRIGLILAVASGAIGLGNFLRFPGQAVQNGGGAFMVPYIISFLILGIPVCLAEWSMGRMGGKHGHSTPFIFKEYLTGVPLKLSGTIGVMIPVMIYVYYVFIESWCLGLGSVLWRLAANAPQSQDHHEGSPHRHWFPRFRRVTPGLGTSTLRLSMELAKPVSRHISCVTRRKAKHPSKWQRTTGGTTGPASNGS